MTLLDVEQLGQVLESTRADLFRMETLPSYDVRGESDDFARWLAGEAEPNPERKQPWLETLTSWAQQGRPRRRVRIVADPPTDYQRFQAEWCYAPNAAAGERIRVLDPAEHYRPRELDITAGDWWLVDGAAVVAMHYHPDGSFSGAEVLDPAHIDRHLAAADAAWRVAAEFGTWWDRHPEHHRAQHRAA